MRMKEWRYRENKRVAAALAVALCVTATTAYADTQPVDPAETVLEEQAEGAEAFLSDGVFYGGGSLQEADYLSAIIVSDTVRVYSLKEDGETYLSKNFQVKEFASHDGADTIYIDEKLVDVLQDIRDHFGAPVTISSAYRTEEHNAAVGGVENSYHTKGMAADIEVSGHTPLEVAQYAEQIGVRGIGCYSTWVHVETRVTSVYYWDGDGNPVDSFLTEEPEEEQTGIAGDADGNGKVEANDALLVLKSVVGLTELGAKQLARVDFNQNGRADASDALCILQKVVGLIE